MKNKKMEITDYDTTDTVQNINTSNRLNLSDLGFTLPETPPTQVVSIRFPTALLNQLRSLASQDDIPYQALIKNILARFVSKRAHP